MASAWNKGMKKVIARMVAYNGSVDADPDRIKDEVQLTEGATDYAQNARFRNNIAAHISQKKAGTLGPSFQVGLLSAAAELFKRYKATNLDETAWTTVEFPKVVAKWQKNYLGAGAVTTILNGLHDQILAVAKEVVLMRSVDHAEAQEKVAAALAGQ